VAGCQAGHSRVTIERYTVLHSPIAREHLAAIEDYIASAGEPEHAVAYTARIVGFCDGLSIFPRRGTKRDDLLAGLYVIGFERRVAITYTIDEAEARVWITGIYYGGQNWETRY